MTLLQSPISATLLGMALIALVAPFALKGLGRSMQSPQVALTARFALLLERRLLHHSDLGSL